MKTQFKHINFEPYPSGWGTWNCYNIKEHKSNPHGGLLGTLAYYKPWKQYVFTAAPNCIFSADCLQDIITFIGELAKEPLPLVQGTEHRP